MDQLLYQSKKIINEAIAIRILGTNIEQTNATPSIESINKNNLSNNLVILEAKGNLDKGEATIKYQKHNGELLGYRIIINNHNTGEKCEINKDDNMSESKE